MTRPSPFPAWDWEDPDGLEPVMAEFTDALAECSQLRTVADNLPVTSEDFSGLGLSGIEFAAFRTRHAAGLGTDLVGLRGPGGEVTAPGRLYLADGASHFTPLDISEPLPFGDGCVEWVYAEHLIEHVPPPIGVRWLSEVRRILAPGGLLRLTTPDLAKYVAGYANGDGFFARHRRRLRSMRVGPPMPERPAFMLNQLFYLYGHRWLYDAAELRHLLSRAGFDPGAVREHGFRMGERPDVAALDTVMRSDESMYLEVTA